MESQDTPQLFPHTRMVCQYMHSVARPEISLCYGQRGGSTTSALRLLAARIIKTFEAEHTNDRVFRVAYQTFDDTGYVLDSLRQMLPTWMFEKLKLVGVHFPRSLVHIASKLDEPDLLLDDNQLYDAVVIDSYEWSGDNIYMPSELSAARRMLRSDRSLLLCVTAPKDGNKMKYTLGMDYVLKIPTFVANPSVTQTECPDDPQARRDFWGKF